MIACRGFLTFSRLDNHRTLPAAVAARRPSKPRSSPIAYLLRKEGHRWAAQSAQIDHPARIGVPGQAANLRTLPRRLDAGT